MRLRGGGLLSVLFWGKSDWKVRIDLDREGEQPQNISHMNMRLGDDLLHMTHI